MESYHPYSALALSSRGEDRTLPNTHRSPRRTAEDCTLEAASSSGPGGPGHSLEEEDVSPPSKYPDYCRTLQFKDSNGGVKELVFPKALDLDRPKRARTTFSAEQLYKLEREFQRNQYLVGRERTDLADNLQLSETQVKVWFQNRRTKYKRDNSRQADERKQHAEGLAACNILRMLQQNSPPVPTKNNPPGPPSHPAPVSTHPSTLPPIPIALSITNRPVGGAMMAQTTFGQMPFSHQTTSRFHFPPPTPPHLAHVHAHSFPSSFYTS